MNMTENESPDDHNHPEQVESVVSIGPEVQSTNPELKPNLRWYVVKVTAGREDTIKESIERRVRIEALDPFFRTNLHSS